MQEWGCLSQDDAETNKIECAIVYHGSPEALRRLMLGKRLRKGLMKEQEKHEALEYGSRAIRALLSRRPWAPTKQTPAFGK